MPNRVLDRIKGEMPNAMNKTIPTFADAVADISYAAPPQAGAQPKRDGVPALYYYPDCDRLRTPFRDAVIEFIYQTALELDDGRLESACVTIYTPRIEYDLETLDLTLTVDAGWDELVEMQRAIRLRVAEWRKDWSDEQRKDYIHRMTFMYMPAKI